MNPVAGELRCAKALRNIVHHSSTLSTEPTIHCAFRLVKSPPGPATFDSLFSRQPLETAYSRIQTQIRNST